MQHRTMPGALNGVSSSHDRGCWLEVESDQQEAGGQMAQAELGRWWAGERKWRRSQTEPVEGAPGLKPSIATSAFRPVSPHVPLTSGVQETCRETGPDSTGWNNSSQCRPVHSRNRVQNQTVFSLYRLTAVPERPGDAAAER